MTVFQARALTPQVAETDTIRFLVGTQSLRFENQVCTCRECENLMYGGASDIQYEHSNLRE